MREFKYEPQPTEGEDGKKIPAEFSGYVLLKIPRYVKRLEIIKDMNFKADKDGAMEAADNTFDAALKIAEIVPKQVLEIKVHHKKSKKQFTSLDDLEYSQEGTALINELGNVILGGIRLGND